jgi:Zn-dependent protease with chaperone function
MDALRSQSTPSLHRASPARPGGIFEQEQEGEQERPPEKDFYQQAAATAEDLDLDEELGEGARQQQDLLQRYRLWTCAGPVERLQAILEVLAPLSQRPEIRYDFFALDTEKPFASSCCHGAVYFSRGLLQGLSWTGVAFLAAHEMAHTELRHYASRRRRLDELRRAIPAKPGSAARQRMEQAAVLAVRHQEEFEADHLAARWMDFAVGSQAIADLHQLCLRESPGSLNRPTHPAFELRVQRLAGRLEPPNPLDYFWGLVG